MTIADTNGRVYAKLSDVKAGDTLETDKGFTCTKAESKLIHADDDGELYFQCRGGGKRHYIDGQDDGDGYLVGLYPTS